MAKNFLTFETPFDTYISSAVIGEGGAGRVYVVANSAGEEYALKCLTPDRITTERLKRFKNEILFCQNCSHPNVVKVVDAGAIIINGTKCPFYIMKRYSGTLRTQLGKITPDKVLSIFSHILNGVEAAHIVKVWHRDLKPENILFEKLDNRMMVADFGIAHFEEEEIYTAVETKVAERLANFQYSAPEQRIRNSMVDHRADIFALGLILNEMFTGQILQGSGHKKISDVASSYAYLDDLVNFMIQQNPSNRPDSIEKIKMELIGRKNAFIALQKYDESKKRVVSATEALQFEPIQLVSFDYNNGILELKLNRNVPPGWTQEFENPRGGHSFIPGYGPRNYSIRGDAISIGVRHDENFIQDIINNVKNYVNAANNGYVLQIQEQAFEESKRQNAELEKQVIEAELRKNILSSIKI